MDQEDSGWLHDFDVAIATPETREWQVNWVVCSVPRGLMPKPKAGTVVKGEDLPQAINEAKAGRVEFRLDKTANIHVPLGKVSFSIDN
jgi:large subunit ribosomal protein L1